MTKRAYQYRFYPTPEQARTLACTFGCTRFVSNWALHLRSTAYKEQGKKLTSTMLSAALTSLKKEQGTAFLTEVSSVPLQQALRHLDKAFVTFFEGRAAYPVYKKKQGRQSATYAASAFTWDGTSLTLARHSQPLALVWSRPLPEECKPSSVTVSRDQAGRYFVSLLIEENIPTLPVTANVIGLDLGLKAFLVTSSGETIDNPKYYARAEKKLAHVQRKHARKKKGSHKREKARKKVARQHARIADMRRDFQHQLSTRLIHENHVICLESLAVKNMLKNHCLAQSIVDVGWSEFVRQLEYKAAWYGRSVVRIDRWYPSSKTCSGCGHVLEELPLDIRSWVCPACQISHERDINAAKNILAVGLTVHACGGTGRPERVKARRARSAEAGNSLS